MAGGTPYRAQVFEGAHLLRRSCEKTLSLHFSCFRSPNSSIRSSTRAGGPAITASRAVAGAQPFVEQRVGSLYSNRRHFSCFPFNHPHSNAAFEYLASKQYLLPVPFVVTYTMTLALHPAFSGAMRPSPSRPRCSLFQRSNLRALPLANAPRPLLCFDTLTNSFSRSSFVLTFIQIAGGCHPGAEQISKPKLEPKPVNSRPTNSFPSKPSAGLLFRVPPASCRPLPPALYSTSSARLQVSRIPIAMSVALRYSVGSHCGQKRRRPELP